MKTRWRPLAVGCAMVLSACSVKDIMALFGTGRPPASAGLAETLGGKWYACGMADHYLDLTVDGSGSIAGKAVYAGSPAYEIRGDVLEADSVAGIIRDATAALEFTPLSAASGSAVRFDQVNAAGSSLKGLKGADGSTLLLQREVDTGIKACPGTQLTATKLPTGGAGLTGGIVTDPGSSLSGTTEPAPQSSTTPGPSGTTASGPTPTPAPSATRATNGGASPTPAPGGNGATPTAAPGASATPTVTPTAGPTSTPKPATPTPVPTPTPSRGPTPTPVPGSQVGGGISND